jgi:hypothetical protein
MMTATWTEQQLDEIDRTDEVHIAPRRGDGSLASPRIVWAVRVGEEVYMRSVKGAEGAWYRTTRARHEGRLAAGGVGLDVAFDDVDPADGELGGRIDAAYRAKYSRYPGPVASITAERARVTTLRLDPR